MQIRSIARNLALSISALCVIASGAMANELFQEDGIFPNHSTDYVRTLNRFASTDTDAAFYNPAGLAFMKRGGLHVEFSSQTLYFKRISSMKYWGITVDTSDLGIPGTTAGLTRNMFNPTFQGPPKEYGAEGAAPCLPGFDLVWKGDRYAVYLSLGAMHAAPGLKFKDGLGLVDFGSMVVPEIASKLFPGAEYYSLARRSSYIRNEYFIGGTVGAAYRIMERLSAALGVRYIYATSDSTIDVYAVNSLTDGVSNQIRNETPWLIKTNVSGSGLGIIVGFDIKPAEIVNIGLKYEYYLPMNLRKRTDKHVAPGAVASSGQLNIFMDSWAKLPWWDPEFRDNVQFMDPRQFKKVSNRIRFQYPQTISMGFSVNILKNLRAETSGEVSLRQFSDLGGREKDWNIGYKVGQCLEWTMIPRVSVSAGYLYNDFGIKKNKRNEADPLLTSHTVGGGLKLIVTENIDVAAGFFYSIYKPEKTRPVDFTRSGMGGFEIPATHWFTYGLDERRWSVGLGITAHLFGKSAESVEGNNAI